MPVAARRSVVATSLLGVGLCVLLPVSVLQTQPSPAVQWSPGTQPLPAAQPTTGMQTPTGTQALMVAQPSPGTQAPTGTQTQTVARPTLNITDEITKEVIDTAGGLALLIAAWVFGQVSSPSGTCARSGQSSTLLWRRTSTTSSASSERSSVNGRP
jgi:hypothetical protein